MIENSQSLSFTPVFTKLIHEYWFIVWASVIRYVDYDESEKPIVREDLIKLVSLDNQGAKRVSKEILKA